MTTELVKTEYGFRDQEIQLIKSQIMPPNSSDMELKLFLGYCQRTGLDPFARQIYAMKRAGKFSAEVSIDGLRATAEKTNVYAGNDDPVFVEGDGRPIKATVTVWKIVGDLRCPFTASARWDQYYPGEKQGFMWNKMPHLMLGKVAEALALRKAFPQQLSGLYSTEEMAQADLEPSAAPKKIIQDFDPDEHADIPEDKIFGQDEAKKRGELPAQPTVNQFPPIKKQISDRLIDIFGTKAEDLDDALEMLSEWRKEDGSIKNPGVRDLTQLNYKVKPGKSYSQAEVVFKNLEKIKKENAKGLLEIWRTSRK